MEKDVIGKGVSYYHDSIDDKHYFSGFLNLALNNIDKVISEFRVRLNINSNSSNVTDIINNYFSNKLSITDWEKGVEVLKEYLPVVEYLDLPITHKNFDRHPLVNKENEKRKFFRKNFIDLIKLIEDLRNFYTHYYHKPIDIPENVFEFLDKTLLAVCVDMRNQKMKTDNTREILKERISYELDILRNLKIEEIKRKKQEGKRVNDKDPQAIENAIFNDAFSHLIYKKNCDLTLKDVHKSKLPANKIGENKIPISRSGLLFALSMFLSKKEIEQCKSNIEGFKGKVFSEDASITNKENSLKFMATHWVFSKLAYKGLKQRVKTSFDKETLLMQIVDELSKVPDEVYRVLSETSKLEFLEDMNEFVQIGEKDDKTLEESIIVHPVIRKRYEDKFNYFAIRFLDEFANFPTLRFQVFAGYYKHDERTKEIKGINLSTNRLVKEKINVFGKLSDVEKHKGDYFSRGSETSWELFPNPSYNFAGGNIPIYIDLTKNGEQARSVYVEIQQVKKKNRTENNEKIGRNKRALKSDIVNQIYGKTGVHINEPTALMTLNEIPALLYEFLINKKTGAELEKLMVDRLVEKFNIINSYGVSHSDSSSQIPKKIKKGSLSQVVVDVNKLISAIEREKEITNDKLNLISLKEAETKVLDKKGKPKRKFVFFTNELGQEATWIANDIKRFMPVAARSNWKGHQHSELQRLLAFYDRYRLNAKELLGSVWSFNSNPHWGSDFQNLFDSQKEFVGFYKQYLKNRLEYLNSFLLGVTNNQADDKALKMACKDVFVVFDKRFYTINTIEKQKRELLSKPLVFDRGIFDPKPTFIPNEYIEEHPELYADWFRFCSEKEDACQKFYSMEREYTSYFEQQLQISQLVNFEKFEKRCDAQIRQVLREDIMLKCVVDFLFERIFNQELSFNLPDFFQFKSERQENERIANEQSKRGLGDYSLNRYNENSIWNKTVAISLFGGQLYEPKVKIKDIGKFRKLERDKKVDSLLSYNPTRVWSKLEIEDELENRDDSYERIRREQLLKDIHLFEKAILESLGFNGQNHPANLEVNGNPNFRQYLVNGALTKADSLPSDELKWLSEIKLDKVNSNEVSDKHTLVAKTYFLALIRNKFSHNQLIEKDIFDLMQGYYQKVTDETYSAYFYRVAQQVISELRHLN